MTTSAYAPAGAQVDLDLDATAVDQLSWEFAERQWSDGLPIVPPTPERVGAMLEGVSDPQRVIAVLDARLGEATLEVIAVNAVMAGCRPEHFPVVVAAVNAVSQADFNLGSVQATTHPVSPLVIVNGPVRHSIGMNGGVGCLGGGNLANATIGRALRLTMLNVGGGIAGTGDRATQGHPGKFSYCMAENEEANPWDPLHVELGFDLEQSTVTVVPGEAPHNINNHVGTTAAHVLTTCADSLCTLGTNNPFSIKKTEMWLILGPEHAATIAGDGWTKSDLRQFVYERARLSVRRLKAAGGMWGMHSWPAWFDGVDDEDMVPVMASPDRLGVVVAGGEGKHSIAVPSNGGSRSATVPVEFDL